MGSVRMGTGVPGEGLWEQGRVWLLAGWVAVGLGLAPVPALAQDAANAAFAQLSARAGEAREAGKLTEAIDLYRQAVEMSPYWMEGIWYIGTLTYELDRYAEGRDAFRRFVQLDPKAGAAWALLGLCEYETQEYQQSLGHLQRAVDMGIGKNEQLGYVTLYHSALLMNHFGEFEAAQTLLSNMALRYADSPSIIEAVGCSILRLKWLPSELPPELREPVLLAGNAGVSWAVNRFEEAGTYYNQLVERYPEMPNVHYAQGVYFLKKDPDAAILEFQRELKITPDHEPALLQLAFEYLKRGDPISALPFARRSVELRPDSFVAHNALGRALLEAGDVDQAVAELEEGVKLAPDSPEMYFSLARAYRRAGRREEAQQARAKFLELDSLRRGEKEGSANAGPAAEAPAVPN